jgi:magnesium-protoporphyrin O-methyltransferase
MTILDSAHHGRRLQAYFDGVGFERWSAIYGQAPLSRVRQSIREGHARMLAQAEGWLAESATPGTLLDAGCGTGLFSIAMARRGFAVTGMDVAPRMVAAAHQAAEAAGVGEQIRFVEGDAANLSGRFDAVACFDVLVHYPPKDFTQLCVHLGQLSRGPLLLTYAPHSRLLAALHWLGGRFPQGQRRTEIQMIPATTVEKALALAGMRIRRTVAIHHGFYHVTLLEAGR